MAKQTINIGSVPNDGTGSTLRDGGDLINDNFNEIYSAIGDGTTLTAGTFVTTTNTVSITNKTFDTTNTFPTITIGDDTSTNFTLGLGGSFEIVGGSGINTAIDNNRIVLSTDGSIVTESSTDVLTNKDLTDASNSFPTLSIGGLTFNLGDTDASPAFDLTDATNYPTSSLTGTITNAQLTGSIENSKTLLTAGTGLTLSTDTLSVDAAQTQITSVGTLGSLTVSGDLTVDTNTLVVDSTNNRVGILDATPAVTLDVGTATDAIFVPKGTTAQRPGAPSNGYLRYNSDDAQFEGYADGEWGAIAGSGSGSAIEPQIFAGDGSTVDFTLTSAPTSENNLLVFIDGAFQAQDSYSVSGTTLTFSTAPANTRVVTVYHARSNISGSNMIVDTMTGDNSDVTLTLSVAPVSENNVQVYFDGVYQSKAN